MTPPVSSQSDCKHVVAVCVAFLKRSFAVTIADTDSLRLQYVLEQMGKREGGRNGWRKGGKEVEREKNADIPDSLRVT